VFVVPRILPKEFSEKYSCVWSHWV